MMAVMEPRRFGRRPRSMRVVAATVCLGAIWLAGCTVKAPDPEPAPSPSVVQSVNHYVLATGCGIREARLGDDIYRATPMIYPPPEPWGRPIQVGTMTVYDDGTARFGAPGGLEALFVLDPDAQELPGCLS